MERDGSGPPEALTFESLYRTQWPAMLRMAWMMTGSRQQAEDVVQDGFLKLEGMWTSVDAPLPYLRTVIVNLVRAGRRYRAVELRHRPHESPPWTDPDLDETWGALAQLPERQRHALVLRYYCDMPIEDIASLLGCRLGTAKSLIHRGLGSLKEVLTA